MRSDCKQLDRSGNHAFGLQTPWSVSKHGTYVRSENRTLGLQTIESDRQPCAWTANQKIGLGSNDSICKLSNRSGNRAFGLQTIRSVWEPCVRSATYRIGLKNRAFGLLTIRSAGNHAFRLQSKRSVWEPIIRSENQQIGLGTNDSDCKPVCKLSNRTENHAFGLQTIRSVWEPMIQTENCPARTENYWIGLRTMRSGCKHLDWSGNRCFGLRTVRLGLRTNRSVWEPMQRIGLRTCIYIGATCANETRCLGTDVSDWELYGSDCEPTDRSGNQCNVLVWERVHI